MKICKTVVTGMLLTLVAMIYVHQRVEIVKAGYEIQKNENYLLELVDQNSHFMYNLSKLESPRYLLASLDLGEVEFANHRIQQYENYQIHLAKKSEALVKEGYVSKFLDFFTLSAEAKTRE